MDKNNLNIALLVVAAATIAPLAVALGVSVAPQFSPLGRVELNRAIAGYSALLLAFFSGARLGSLLTDGGGTSGIWLALAGLLLGMLVLFLPFGLALALLIVGFGALGAWDAWSGFQGKLSAKYTAMRTQLTWIVCLILLLILVIQSVPVLG